MSKFNPRKAVLVTLSLLVLVSSTITVQKYLALRSAKKEKVAAKKFEEGFNNNNIYPIELNEKAMLTFTQAKGFSLYYHVELEDWYDAEAVEEYKNSGFGLSLKQKYCSPEFIKKPITFVITLRFLMDKTEVVYEESLEQYCHFDPNLF